MSHRLLFRNRIHVLPHYCHGDAAAMAEYFTALQRRISPDEAVIRIVLRNRTSESIEAEWRTLCRKMALQIDPS